MKYIFHPEALSEYLGSVGYYAEINTNLGEAFVEEVEAAVERILSHPQAWPCIEANVRRCLLHRFPFGVYYCVEDEAIVIYALMHMSRRPDYWQGRMNDEAQDGP